MGRNLILVAFRIVKCKFSTKLLQISVFQSFFCLFSDDCSSVDEFKVESVVRNLSPKSSQEVIRRLERKKFIGQKASQSEKGNNILEF